MNALASPLAPLSTVGRELAHDSTIKDRTEKLLHAGHEKLRLIIAEPWKYSVEIVLCEIGAAGSAFHDRLAFLSSDDGMASGKGWGQESWGPQMKTVGDEGYHLMTESLWRVTAAALDRLEQAGELAQIESLQTEVRQGLEHLERYQQSGLPVHDAVLIPLQKRASI